MVVIRDSSSSEYTSSLAAGLAALLRGGDILRLEGELGAGKTTFVRALAAGLGIPAGLVSSPTFVLVNEYPLASEIRGIRRVVHVDAYRLKSSEDLEPLGWDRFMTESGARADCIVIVEWPERIEEALTRVKRTIRVKFEHAGETERRIEFQLPDSLAEREGFELFRAGEPVRCPVSGVWVEPTRKTYPFAGEREKLADLNRWFTGQYKIVRPANENDFSQADDLGRTPDPGQGHDN